MHALGRGGLARHCESQWAKFHNLRICLLIIRLSYTRRDNLVLNISGEEHVKKERREIDQNIKTDVIETENETVEQYVFVNEVEHVGDSPR